MSETINEISNFITGKSIKDAELKTAIVRCLFLTNHANERHILLCMDGERYYVRTLKEITWYNKEQMSTLYGIEITDELINKLSIK